jgi:hypothetical protein
LDVQENQQKEIRMFINRLFAITIGLALIGAIALAARGKMTPSVVVASASSVHENIAEHDAEILERNTAAGADQIQTQLAQVRAATAQFHSTEAAKKAGYAFVPGLDSCFDNPGVGGMGFHLIKGVDLTVNALEPEAMVYAPGPNGQLQLAAVEYIVPAKQWDDAGNTQVPSVLGQSFHLDSALGVYILHAWIWRVNPLGMFADWNPKVSCR